MINKNGDTVVCIREESDVVFSQNFHSWVHRLREKKKVEQSWVEQDTTSQPKAEPAILDMVYRMFMEKTGLIERHIQHLTSDKREMNMEEIQIRGYRSFPEKPWEVVKLMLPNQNRFPAGIPGFYKNEYGWTINGHQGILIPFRNHYNQIVGFQLRVDEPKNDVEINKGSIDYLNAKVVEQPDRVQIYVNGERISEKVMMIGETETVIDGSDSGTVKLVKGQRYYWLSSSNRKAGTGAGSPLPVHVAVSSAFLRDWEEESARRQMHVLHRANAVWITEGGLKADIAAEHIEKVYSPQEQQEIGSTVLGVPGVNTWKTIIPVLEEMGVKRVNIAFDMDVMSNENVQYHLKEFIMYLKKKGYAIYLSVWNEQDGKGIDDVFINRRVPQLRKMA